MRAFCLSEFFRPEAHRRREARLRAGVVPGAAGGYRATVALHPGIEEQQPAPYAFKGKLYTTLPNSKARIRLPRHSYWNSVGARRAATAAPGRPTSSKP
jgi:hypothetical protein